MSQINLEPIDRRHKSAMRLVDFADDCRTGIRIITRKNIKVADLYRKAADIELQCARNCEGVFPSVLVLARSAASLYINAGDIDRGVKVATEYSKKNSPDGPIEINGELEELAQNPSIATF